MEFANYIKELRKAKGLSARELARRSGVSQPYLSQLETGKHKQPTRKAIEKLAKGLEADYDELLVKAGYLSSNETERMELLKKANKAVKEDKALNDSLQAFTKSIPDLHELLNSDSNLLYNGRLLVKEEKEKILTFIEMILK